MRGKEIAQSDVLTTITQNYTFDGCVLDDAIPAVPITKKEGKYYVFGEEELYTWADDFGEEEEANILKMRATTATYESKGHGLKSPISNLNVRIEDPAVQQEVRKTEKIARALRIAREVRFAALLDATVGTTSVDSGDKSNAWATAASGTPLADLLAMKQDVRNACGVNPNLAIIPMQCAEAMIACEEVQKRIYYNRENVADFDTLPPNILGMRVLTPMQMKLGEQTVTTHVPATVSSKSTVWGDHVYLLYVATTPAIDEPSAMYRFQLVPEFTRRLEAPELGIEGSFYVQTAYHQVLKVVHAYAVGRIQNVV